MASIYNNPISAFHKIQSLPPETLQLGWAIVADDRDYSFHLYTFQDRGQLANFIMQVEEENAIAPPNMQVTTFCSLGRFAGYYRQAGNFATYLKLYIKMEESTTATERWDALRKFMEIPANAA